MTAAATYGSGQKAGSHKGSHYARPRVYSLYAGVHVWSQQQGLLRLTPVEVVATFRRLWIGIDC